MYVAFTYNVGQILTHINSKNDTKFHCFSPSDP